MDLWVVSEYLAASRERSSERIEYLAASRLRAGVLSVQREMSERLRSYLNSALKAPISGQSFSDILLSDQQRSYLIRRSSAEPANRAA